MANNMDFKMSDDIKECKVKFENIIKCLSASSNKSKEIIEALEGDTWTSKSKDSLLSLMLLSSKFNDKLLEVMNSNSTTLNSLANDVDEFMDTCLTIKNLEG